MCSAPSLSELTLYWSGEEGFKVYMDKLVGELKSTMTMCGAPTLRDITRDKVRY